MARIRIMLPILVAWMVFVLSGASTLWAQPSPPKPAIERSPLLKEPTTPEEMFAAAVLTADLARLDLARLYLEQFEATEPDNETLIQLRDKYGTSDFVKLSLFKELQPNSQNLLDRLNAAARLQAADPAFVDTLIKRLSVNETERALATAELRNAGIQVVPEILRQMSLQEMVDQQDTLLLALVRMGPQVVPALTGAMDTPDERVRAAIIDALGYLKSPEAIPYLWFPAFDEQQPAGVQTSAKNALSKLLKSYPKLGLQFSSVTAANELRRLARLYYRTPQALPVDDDGNVHLWTWSDAVGTVVDKAISPQLASLYVATRFARQSLALSPEQPEPQRQYLAALLGLEVLRQGWDTPRVSTPGTAMYLGLTAGEETMAQVLAEALDAKRPSTAVPALEILGQLGTREQLISRNGTKSPVLAALNSPDPRVQFTAATTILKLDPKHGFSGSNRIVGILARALTDVNQPRAIVIDSDVHRASAVMGYMSSGGYAADMAASGRQGFELASTLTGVEVVLIHVNVQRWDLTQTLSNFRADARTSQLPIVLYGPGDLTDDLTRLVTRSAPATYIAESATVSDFLDQFFPFIKSVKSDPLTPQERDLQMSTAAYWLATIGSGSLSKIFDLSQVENELVLATENPAIATNALIGLAGVRTPSAQRRLADIAVNPQMIDGVRQTAANQLAYHIQQFGLMLTKDEVINLHAGWKNTENPDVKGALASVIGSLRPNPTIVSERLRAFPVPVAN